MCVFFHGTAESGQTRLLTTLEANENLLVRCLIGIGIHTRSVPSNLSSGWTRAWRGRLRMSILTMLHGERTVTNKGPTAVCRTPAVRGWLCLIDAFIRYVAATC